MRDVAQHPGAQIPSNDTRDIIRVAMECLARIFLPGMRYQKAGVMLGDFYGIGVAQLALFDEHKPRSNSEALMRVLDGINHSGLGKVWFAGQGIQQAWRMKRALLSPRYTTQYKDLPVVIAK